MPSGRAIAAEFIGTFALTLVGAGAIIATSGMNASLIAVALAHGLILGVMVSATMHISGGQLNPAVSFGLAAIRVQPWPQAMSFIAAQCIGAVAAAGILRGVLHGLPNVDIGNLGATLGSLSAAGDIGRVFVLEIIATFFLMYVILYAAVDKSSKVAPAAGLCIGLTVAANILAIGPLTGASMNPARSLGPALVASAWTMHWVYWLAPIIGAGLAAALYHFTLPASQAVGSRT